MGECQARSLQISGGFTVAERDPVPKTNFFLEETQISNFPFSVFNSGTSRVYVRVTPRASGPHYQNGPGFDQKLARLPGSPVYPGPGRLISGPKIRDHLGWLPGQQPLKFRG